MGKAKKALNIALKVISWLLIAFTVFIMVFTIITVTTADQNERSIFGTKFFIVRTDSMSLSDKNKDLDVHFDAGDIVLIKSLDEDAKKQLEIGDVIAFVSTNSTSYGETITHMIRDVVRNKDGQLLGYTTYGTNTGVNDEALVEPSYVLGTYSGKLPGVGNFFAFVKSTTGYIVCILVPFLILIIVNGIQVIRLFRKYKREQAAVLQAEKDEIEAERAENQRMMQELLALKAQLEQKSGEGTPPATPASEVDSAEETAPTEATDENKDVQ